MNSITANQIQVKSVVGDDYSYVTIGVTWKGKENLEIPTENDKTQVMWSHESAYGVVGSKVGDFIGCYGESSSLQEGIFTHRNIAELLIEKFSGLKYNELIWHENPLEKKLKSGKLRAKKAKWLPEKEADIVHLYSDQYIDVRNPKPEKTDFYVVYRENKGKSNWRHTWLMCSDETATRLREFNFSCLYIEESTIIGKKT
ncbi:hypothetical protein [Algibacter lectus]|uniref:Uncharacterized protein n=1 Tax=Algibacter lectus TaxID=221126 RepID=A0A4R8MKT5_9FLAO|nr:hypothetical protein [Algibacter lectus]TDY64565.1 hypothetical protein DFQ06_1477 [Algibacter lectus]